MGHKKPDPQAAKARLKEENARRTEQDAEPFYCHTCKLCCTKGELRKGTKKHYPRTCRKMRRKAEANKLKAERASQ